MFIATVNLEYFLYYFPNKINDEFVPLRARIIVDKMEKIVIGNVYFNYNMKLN